MQSTIKELRLHTEEILDSVHRGEEIIVTFRGKPYAKIVPLKESEKDKESKNELFGIWKDRKDMQNFDEYIRKLRKGRINVDN